MTGQLLLRKTREYARVDDPGWFPSRQSTIRRNTTVWDNETSLVLEVSANLTGINHHSGNRWYRWQTEARYGFRKTSRGNIVPFGRGQHGGWSLAQMPFKIMEWTKDEGYAAIDRDCCKAFVDAAKAKWGIESEKDVYPILKFHENTYKDIPSNLFLPLRESQYNDFVRKAFGTSRYRKDLVKACANSPLVNISIARWFRGLVPIDWIIKFLNDNTTAIIALNEWSESINGELPTEGKMRPLLNSIDRRSLRHLLRSTPDAYHLGNFARRNQNTFEVEDKVYRTWNDLHEVIVNDGYFDQIAAKPRENKKIKLIELAKSLQGTMLGREYKIVMPTETNTVYEWGNKMHNCIGGYAHQAAKGSTILGAIENSKGKIVANFEITPERKRLIRANESASETDYNQISAARLIQFFGPCNGPVAKELENLFYSVCAENDIDCRTAWSAQEQIEERRHYAGVDNVPF